MNNYNDGNWWGWNGGECPVNPESEVDGIDSTGCHWRATAGDNHWNSFRGAFRVTKEYIEPPKAREFWIDTDTGVGYNERHNYGLVKFREVME